MNPIHDYPTLDQLPDDTIVVDDSPQAYQRIDGQWLAPGSRVPEPSESLTLPVEVVYDPTVIPPDEQLKAAISRAESAEVALTDLRAELDDPYSERNQKAGAWEVVEDHLLFNPIDELPTAASYADEVRLRLDEIAEELKPSNPWTVLREAADLISFRSSAHDAYGARDVARELADRLEAEAARDAEVDALIEKAARIAWETPASGNELSPPPWDDVTELTKVRYRREIRALHAAGLLVEGGAE